MTLTELAPYLGAISILFGSVSTLAAVAWRERGLRTDKCERENEYYRNQVMPALAKITDATEVQNRGLAVLTDVVKDSLRRNDA